MNISLSAFAPENLVSRDRFGSPVPRQSLISILGLNLVLIYGIPPEFRGGVHFLFKPSYAVGAVPSLSGRASAYRRRSLPRVHRYRRSKSQGSSELVLPWQVTMDQLMCASLFHAHCWYKVGMLKVPAYHQPICDLVLKKATNWVSSGVTSALARTRMRASLTFLHLRPYNRRRLLLAPSFAKDAVARMDYHPSQLVLMIVRAKYTPVRAPLCP